MKKKSLRVRLKHWLRGDRRRVLLSALSVAGGVIFLRLSGLLLAGELAVYDQMFRLRDWERNPRIVNESDQNFDDRFLIVEINEEDIQQAGKWPIPDRAIAQLLEKLNASQPRAIGLDIYRDLPVAPGHEDFVRVSSQIPNLIGIEKLASNDSPAVPPPPQLTQKNQIGFNNVVSDADGKVRRFLLYSHQNGELHTSFALKLALIYLESQNITPQPAQVNPDYLQLGKGVFRSLKTNDGAYIATDNKGYQVLANYFHPKKFQKVSMGDVLADRVSADLVRDRIILIGWTASSVKDFFSIPYSTGFSEDPQLFSGVELHANFIGQILSTAISGRPLMRVLPESVEWLWIIAWSGVGAMGIAYSPNTLRGSVVVSVAMVILTASAYLAFLVGWWLPLVPPWLGLIASAVVVTSHLAHQQEELKRSQEFLQSVIDKIPDPIFVKDRDYRWIILNQAFCDFSGYLLSELLGKTDRNIFPANEAYVFWSQDRFVFETNTACENEEKFTDAQGMTHLIATKRSLHQDAAGNVFLVGVIRDITERKHLEEQLRQLAADLSRHNAELKRSAQQLHQDAYYDSLTGLGNRRFFNESLAKSLEWAQKNKRLVGLLFLDLNKFKPVNDTFGHDVGDLLLKEVAVRLSNNLRSSDVVCRLGGDEFTVILPGIKEKQDAEKVAEKITGAVSEGFVIGERKISMTASVGISLYPDDGENIEALVKQADLRMYEFKQLNCDRA
ncbi:MAG: CHASE2 domain-containing protein [Oscillatoria sp. PMC 1068.18]|nr:CHASE2 domain-containing protein [Oscillatoria sp. PMC 1076.18]MEC4989164.1 CHASE2 domain-containing protein [Oscillatoria sp. PMC 1068.18]